jgi:hypothetical protein
LKRKYFYVAVFVLLYVNISIFFGYPTPIYSLAFLLSLSIICAGTILILDKVRNSARKGMAILITGIFITGFIDLFTEKEVTVSTWVLLISVLILFIFLAAILAKKRA